MNKYLKDRIILHRIQVALPTEYRQCNAATFGSEPIGRVADRHLATAQWLSTTALSHSRGSLSISRDLRF